MIWTWNVTNRPLIYYLDWATGYSPLPSRYNLFPKASDLRLTLRFVWVLHSIRNFHRVEQRTKIGVESIDRDRWPTTANIYNSIPSLWGKSHQRRERNPGGLHDTHDKWNLCVDDLRFTSSPECSHDGHVEIQISRCRIRAAAEPYGIHDRAKQVSLGQVLEIQQ